jgi:hypothetical protein
MVGERGFEPPTPWSRTRCSTRLSHSPTEVSPFILLHVTSNVLCSENPETWDPWDHPPARTVLEPAPFAVETHHRSARIRTWFSGSSVQLAPAGDLPAFRWPGAWRRGRDEMRASLLAAARDFKDQLQLAPHVMSGVWFQWFGRRFGLSKDNLLILDASTFNSWVGEENRFPQRDRRASLLCSDCKILGSSRQVRNE